MKKGILSATFNVVVISAVITLSTMFSPLVSLVTAQAMPPAATAYSSISVKVNGVSANTLYNFTTDLTNDHLWFPNVEETVIVQGPTSPYSKKGTKYIQRTYFNGIQLDTTAKVTGDLKGIYYELEGTGAVANYNAYYTFIPGINGGTFTLTTKFVSPGITEENLTYLLNTAMQNILNHYNTTGRISMHFIYVTQ